MVLVMMVLIYQISKGNPPFYKQFWIFSRLMQIKYWVRIRRRGGASENFKSQTLPQTLVSVLSRKNGLCYEHLKKSYEVVQNFRLKKKKKFA